MVADLLDEAGAQLVAELGARARFVHLDVTDEAGWDAAVTAADDFGGVDVLVNNAGIANAAPIEHFTTAKWDAVSMSRPAGSPPPTSTPSPGRCGRWRMPGVPSSSSSTTSTS